MNLIGVNNNGYTIIKQGEKAVIGKSENNMYVGWSYKILDNWIPDFYYGRYGNERHALKAFRLKEKGEYSG